MCRATHTRRGHTSRDTAAAICIRQRRALRIDVKKKIYARRFLSGICDRRTSSSSSSLYSGREKEERRGGGSFIDGIIETGFLLQSEKCIFLGRASLPSLPDNVTRRFSYSSFTSLPPSLHLSFCTRGRGARSRSSLSSDLTNTWASGRKEFLWRVCVCV